MWTTIKKLSDQELMMTIFTGNCEKKSLLCFAFQDHVTFLKQPCTAISQDQANFIKEEIQTTTKNSIHWFLRLMDCPYKIPLHGCDEKSGLSFYRKNAG
jgi:hypothetical protein